MHSLVLICLALQDSVEIATRLDASLNVQVIVFEPVIEKLQHCMTGERVEAGAHISVLFLGHLDLDTGWLLMVRNTCLVVILLWFIVIGILYVVRNYVVHVVLSEFSYSNQVGLEVLITHRLKCQQDYLVLLICSL